MTARELFDAVGLVGDDLIQEAAAPVVRRRTLPWQSVVMTAACLCLVIGVAGASGLGRLKAGSAAPTAASEEYSLESAARTDEDLARGGMDESVPAAAEGDAVQDKETAAALAALCPVDVTDYPLWAVCDRSGWENNELFVNAGMLMVLPDADGAPFSGGQTLTVQADGPFTLAYAAQGGAPVMVTEPGREAAVTLPEDGGAYYFCVLAGEEDITILAREETK